MKTLLWILTGISIFTLSVGPAVAKEEHATTARKTTSSHEMGNYPQGQMEAWMKNAEPGEHHGYLEPLIGNWKLTMRHWMKPGDKVEESQGTSENHWIMGNRFVQQEVKGEAMGKPFEGMGIIGYDNVKGEYSAIWLASMGTGIMVSSAQYDAKKKEFNEWGTTSCPMTGENNKHFRSVWKIANKNQNTYEMYTPGPDGKEFKTMEIVYKRAGIDVGQR